MMFGLFIWWYLVAYNPDAWTEGEAIGEFTALAGPSGCLGQLDIYYARDPRGFARCEGSQQRQEFNMNMVSDRKKQELEMEKLKLEIENQSLELEARRRILRDWPAGR